MRNCLGEKETSRIRRRGLFVNPLREKEKENKTLELERDWLTRPNREKDTYSEQVLVEHVEQEE